METNNYKLKLCEDDSVRFIDWRRQINGSDESNMVIIDRILTSKADKGDIPSLDGYATEGYVDDSLSALIIRYGDEIDSSEISGKMVFCEFISSGKTIYAPLCRIENDEYMFSCMGESGEVILITHDSQGWKSSTFALTSKDEIESLRDVIIETEIGVDWDGDTAPYSQRINLSGGNIGEDSIIDVSLSSSATLDQVKAFGKLSLVDGGQGDGYIQLRAWGEKNLISIPIKVIIRGNA